MAGAVGFRGSPRANNELRPLARVDVGSVGNVEVGGAPSRIRSVRSPTSVLDRLRVGTADERSRLSTGPTVLFTGFPGFLGSALLERVLDRGDGPVACLVQPEYLGEARRRARAIVSGHDGDRDGTESDGSDRAVHLYTGDITEPDLGLGGALDDDGSLSSVREVYHLAAVYDLGVDPALAEAVNVRGTDHVLDAAEQLDVDRFHYVSTCYVSGRYDGEFTETGLREGQSFNNHYEATKYRAEVAVRERMAEGFPATVYRPSIVVGDSRTGETDKLDGPYNLLRLLLAQPRTLSVLFELPNSGRTEMNVVPRDYVVDAMAALSDHEGAVGRTYQLCDPDPLCVPEFVDALADAAGHRIVTLPTTKRVARAGSRLLAGAGIRVDPATLDYLDHPTRYRCPETTRALAECDARVSVPPVESYADALVRFARGHPNVRDEPMV